MASLQFQEKFRHRAKLVSKQGELDTSQSRPINPDYHSAFLRAGAAIALVPSHFPAQETEEPLVFAKPIKLARRMIVKTDLEGKEQVLSTPSAKAASEPASGHRLNRSIDFAENPVSCRHQRQGSMPVQDLTTRVVNFVPYSLQDYRLLKGGGKWVPLGGIGPRSQESDAWQRSHFVHKRRSEYARQLHACK